MKAINQEHINARLINEIDDILDLKISSKYSDIIIKQIIQDWRDAN